MISSCCFLYLLKRWRLISFEVGESLTFSDNSTKLVPLRTLRHTLPIAGTYLLYMVFASFPFFRGQILNHCSFSFLFFFYLFLIKLNLHFSLKDSHHGVCPWSKCSNVYHPSEDHSGIYDACGVYSGGAEVYILCYFQVKYFLSNTWCDLQSAIYRSKLQMSHWLWNLIDLLWLWEWE